MSRLRTVIGATLRRKRQAQGRTLREVSVDAGVSLTYLSEVERGRKEASSEVLEAVCAALDLVLADLLFEVAEELVGLDARASLPRRAVPPRVGFLPGLPPAADPAPVARVIDLRAFAGRRSA